MPSSELTRRALVKGAAAFAAGAAIAPKFAFADTVAATLPEARPKVSERKFKSQAVEETIQSVSAKIGDPNLAVLFANCFPNTLDTTVFPETRDGKPETHVVTGDIDAMWLRDSSAQVWPYLPLLKKDEQLRELVEGVIRRQGRLIRLDPYANAFLHHETDKPLSWAVEDKTKHIAGVGERKWEIDSLCYPIRLAHGYWKETGDTKPFDSGWPETAHLIVKTFREQQRKDGPGPYSFQRSSPIPTDTVPLSGFGNPAKPNGMIYSMFRPSDDSCIYPLFVPANLFAVVSLRKLADLATGPFNDAKLATECRALADEVEKATRAFGMTRDAKLGEIWAYEVDGFGNVLKMDDANAPGLLTMAYLGSVAFDDPLYRRTRAFTLSEANPYFFKGSAGEGIGGPHEGLGMIWPMSIMMRAFTAEKTPAGDAEVRQCLKWLRDTTAGTGFMHETFQKDDPKEFTRPWFAWANTLFGELVLRLAAERPAVLAAKL
jgi:meiotically up-regulated gene 157 (Mug157) protein